MISSLRSPDPAPDSAPARVTVGPLLLLAAVLSAVGLASWRPVPAGVWNDDGVYLVIAEALAEGDGLSYAGVPGEVPAVKFPPAYPIVLSALWAVLPGVGAVTVAAVALNLLLLVGAGVLLALALGRSQRFAPGVAIGLAGLAFLSADVWRLGLVPLSESLFLGWMAAALACWPAAARPGGRRALVLLSAVLTAAVLTRSAGAALVVGFGFALALERGVRTAAAVVSVPVVAAGAWGWWAASKAREIPDGMQDVLGPYGGWLSAQLLGAPGEFFAALPAHLLTIARLACRLLLPGIVGPWFAVAGAVLGLLVVYGLWLLHRRFPPIVWVALAYMAMLAVWPFVDRRLVAPLHPLLLVAAGTAMVELWRGSGGSVGPLRNRDSAAARRGFRLAFAGAAALWVSLYSGVSLWRTYDGWAAEPYRLRAEWLATAVETLSRTAPPDAVVGAPELWAALHLHGGWQAAPSALFLPRSADGAPVWGTPEDQVALWWDARVEYLVLESGGQFNGDALTLVEGRCPGAVRIVARMPPQMLVRVQWSDACATALGLEVGGG